MGYDKVKSYFITFNRSSHMIGYIGNTCLAYTLIRYSGMLSCCVLLATKRHGVPLSPFNIAYFLFDNTAIGPEYKIGLL